MARLFDAFIIVDWSAASAPKTGPNSIWIGVYAKDARFKFQFQAVNPDTRLKANTFLKEMLDRLTKRGDTVFLGFDFSLGYPAGTAEALGLTKPDQPAWSVMHEHLAAKLKDKPDNSNARFAIAAGMNYTISKGPFPFWGAPTRDQVSTLAAKKGAFEESSLSEYRLVEESLRNSKRGQPKSVWQLAYTGSVGSQSLLGIPHVQDLHKSMENVKIWPFETGFVDPYDPSWLNGISVLIAEVYPSLVKTTPEQGEVLDKAQVRSLAEYLEKLDSKHQLAALFAPPSDIHPCDMEKIILEEGWILGA